MTIPAGFEGLRFPCECVSSRAGGYSDPWAEITKNKLLPNGTKEEILNVLAQGPKTITQIAEALSLSAPSVHTHISDMLRSELLREAVESEKTHPAERYYEPNFPVFKAEVCAEFRSLCEEMAQQVVALFEVATGSAARDQIEISLQRNPLHHRSLPSYPITRSLPLAVPNSSTHNAGSFLRLGFHGLALLPTAYRLPLTAYRLLRVSRATPGAALTQKLISNLSDKLLLIPVSLVGFV
jgi:DNA-binding transcriptional ArsR family regulator